MFSRNPIIYIYIYNPKNATYDDFAKIYVNVYRGNYNACDKDTERDDDCPSPTQTII